MIAKTKQTYDVQSMSGYSYGRFTSLTEARKKACKLAYNYVGERGDIKIIKNPAILPNGYFRPATIFIIVTSVMFIRPKYDYKCFGKELVIENGKITGQYKYYLIDSRTGNISMSDPSFKRYFDGSMRSGVWNRPRK